jgi:hypothetical protein
MLLARQLSEAGAPQALVASVEEVVDNFFREGPPRHCMEALHPLFPMLKNKIKISPLWDGASTES